MKPEDQARMLAHLDRLHALISQGAVVAFAIVAIHPTEMSTDIADLGLPGAARYVDRLVQQMDRLLFKLKAGIYLAPQPSGIPTRPTGNGGGQ